MVSNSTGVLVTMTTESLTRSVSVSVTSSDYYNISLTGNSVCSGNLTTSVTTDSERLFNILYTIYSSLRVNNFIISSNCTGDLVNTHDYGPGDTIWCIYQCLLVIPVRPQLLL